MYNVGLCYVLGWEEVISVVETIINTFYMLFIFEGWLSYVWEEGSTKMKRVELDSLKGLSRWFMCEPLVCVWTSPVRECVSMCTLSVSVCMLRRASVLLKWASACARAVGTAFALFLSTPLCPHHFLWSETEPLARHNTETQGVVEREREGGVEKERERGGEIRRGLLCLLEQNQPQVQLPKNIPLVDNIIRY